MRRFPALALVVLAGLAFAAPASRAQDAADGAASEAARQALCERQLMQAEAEIARVLAGYDYAFTISATGKSTWLAGTRCAASITRSVEMTYTRQEN